MNYAKFSKKIIITAFALLPVFAWAKDGYHDHKHDHEETKSQEAHVHGLAELALAIEVNYLELALTSPAANIVGFEHKASTPEQKQTVEDAKKALESPTELFTFIGTECEPKQTRVDLFAVITEDEKTADTKSTESHTEEKHHDDHGHKHDENQADEHKQAKAEDTHKHEEKHDEHKHADEKHAKDSSYKAHSEITANYQFDCKKVADLTAISVNLLDQFTGIETLNAMWITDNGQNAAELTVKSKDIKLR